MVGFVRTVCVPLHYETDRVKLEKLDKLTARLSYCVSVFLDIIRLSGVVTKEGLSQFEKDVQKATGLSSGFVQQCRDKAVWMWQSYLKLHRIWDSPKVLLGGSPATLLRGGGNFKLNPFFNFKQAWS